MKLLAALILALAASAAHAQTIAPPDTWLPSCAPSSITMAGMSIPIGGSGTPVVIVKTAYGTGYTWRCPDNSLPYKLIAADYTGPSVSDVLSQALSYQTPIDAIKALWHKYDTTMYLCASATPSPCEAGWVDLDERTIYASFQIPKFVAPAWIVAPNPLSTTTPPTRASFAVVNGVRSFGSAGTVAVGSACDCSAISLTEGSTTFCSVAPSRVSVCTKP